jgi:hypothetical protein
MKLFEVDTGGARDVMAVLQGLANKPGKEQASELPWPTVQRILKPFALGINTPDGLIALKNQVDPNGDVIKSVDSKTGKVTLNTGVQKPEDQAGAEPGQATGPSVDAMASSNSKTLSPKI